MWQFFQLSYIVGIKSTDIYLSPTLRNEYLALSYSVIDLLTLKILIKEVIGNLVIDSDNM